ncbi:MAG: ATP-dependent DNA helicase [Acidimicrobiia bacterium]|nr:ATP-dependent DNA helicase [Acidimicrobiia bacterium]
MPPPQTSPTARQFFHGRGLLSEWHPQYEYRPGQQEMAEAVEGALAEKRHLVVEAGTGTGKTLAYLIPAILSGKRVVVSTGTKNLQEQLYFKDIPFLARHMNRELRVSYMKGRKNYLCRQKVYDAEKEPVLAGLEEVADYQVIREWEKTTEMGDRAEIRQLPAGSTAWSKLDARRELCSGQKCAQFERCFITRMQQRARESDIIIVNHHLFFADLAVKDRDYEGIIPDYQAVIFDEAHEIESVAGDYFGCSISNHQVEDLRRDITALARRKNFGTQELDRVLMTLDECADRFFAVFAGKEGRSGIPDRVELRESCEAVYQDLLRVLELTGAHLQLVKGATDELIPLNGRVEELRQTLQFWMESDDSDFVYWIERRGRGVYLEATPIDVSSLLRDKLFDQVDTIILTSATLAVGGGFEYVKTRLGIPAPRTAIVQGPFDYPKQALLYVANGLPDPRSPSFTESASEEVIRLLEMSKGRAFVLFTSYQQMRAFHDRISFEIEYPTLLQGTGPNHALLDEFRNTPHCVLFATSSFWQGVDVPGDNLSCVIIDKLPFAVPTDPVVEARVRAIREAGGDAFHDYQVPSAALALKQGFGRLIRSRSDRGVLALLDNRITKQRYGQIFFDSLPDYGFTMQINEVARFFDV